MDATFSGPGNQVFVVPAFYDGDGSGSLDGNVWKVRFSPNAAGTWDYVTNSPEGSLNGHSGSFELSDTQVYKLMVEVQPSSTPIPSGTPTDAPPEITTTPKRPGFAIFIPFVHRD